MIMARSRAGKGRGEWRHGQESQGNGGVGTGKGGGEMGEGAGRRTQWDSYVTSLGLLSGMCNVGPESQVWGRIVTQMIPIASSNTYKVPATDELLPLRPEFRPYV